MGHHHRVQNHNQIGCHSRVSQLHNGHGSGLPWRAATLPHPL